jgi:glycosyltransferase involved in cell wall biosynthesis
MPPPAFSDQLSPSDLPSPVPLVSIIVPNYNHACFLGDRLSSILHQTCRDYELIILDDASRDDSLALIEAVLAGHPYQLIVNQFNSGSPCSQWLRGIERARGKYIWIAESDDACEPEFLANMLAMMGDNISLAYSRSLAMDVSGHAIGGAGVYWPDQFDATLFHTAFTMANRDFCRRFLVNGNVIPNASAVLFHRDLGLAVGRVLAPQLQKLLYVGDWLFWFHYLSSFDGYVAFAAEQDSWFRHHGASTRSTSNSQDKEEQHIDEYCEVIQLISAHPSCQKSMALRQRMLNSGWDWIYLEYCFRCQPSLAQILRSAGLHGPLAKLFPLRLLLSSPLRRHFFPGLFSRTHHVHQGCQTWLAKLKHRMKNKLV